MLSRENNESICRVGPGTAMGKAFRRFWLPALLSSELPAPDGDPRRVQLLGEDFIAFRDSAGKVGILDEYCCHRGASLALGRVEAGGIRCIYHGWKFAVDGTVLETPNVADPAFKERFKARSYPVREAGGLVWVYLGPPAAMPAFPRWPFFELAAPHLLPVYAVVSCNYVQIMEGLVDSSHLTLLHTSPLKTTGSSELDFAKKTEHMQFHAAPRIEAEETDFGFHYVAMRPVSENPADGTMARIASFVPPCFVLNPNGDLFFAIVPVSDTRTLFFHVWWNADKKIGEEPLRSQQLEFVGLDQAALDAYGLSLRTCDSPQAACRANNFLQDREAQRKGHFTGLPSFTQEDAAVGMSGGAIRDRSREILSVADVALPKLYRALMACAKAAAEGRDPPGLHADTTNIVGVSGPLAPGLHWRSLAVQHKVVETASAAWMPPTEIRYLKMLALEGRGFVVLGAGQGIGAAVTHALAQAGATVLCVDNDEGRAQSIARDVKGHACRADVMQRADMERLFGEAQARLGQVSGIVDIVGIARIKQLAAFDDAAWGEQFDQVLRHAFLTLQIGAAALKAAGGGTITFVGSMAGLRAVREQVAYGTAKAALHHLVRSAASELARDRIRVNAVAPGFIRTPRLEQILAADQWKLIEQAIPLGRAAQPHEIAAPLLFLASELSSHVTGQVLAVDGGLANQAALPVLAFAKPQAKP